MWVKTDELVTEEVRDSMILYIYDDVIIFDSICIWERLDEKSWGKRKKRKEGWEEGRDKEM